MKSFLQNSEATIGRIRLYLQKLLDSWYAVEGSVCQQGMEFFGRFCCPRPANLLLHAEGKRCCCRFIDDSRDLQKFARITDTLGFGTTCNNETMAPA